LSTIQTAVFRTEGSLSSNAARIVGKSRASKPSSVHNAWIRPRSDVEPKAIFRSAPATEVSPRNTNNFVHYHATIHWGVRDSQRAVWKFETTSLAVRRLISCRHKSIGIYAPSQYFYPSHVLRFSALNNSLSWSMYSPG